MHELTRQKIALAVEDGQALIDVGAGCTAWLPVTKVMALLQTPYRALPSVILCCKDPVEAAVLLKKLTRSRT